MNNRDFLKSFFTEHWKYLTVNTACKLNLFEVLESSAKTSLEISQHLAVAQQHIKLLLKGLVSIKFLDKEENIYALNDLSVYLTENHPETLKYACLNWSGDHLQAWMALDESVKTGKSFFQNNYNQDYFEFLNQDKKKLDQYQKAMFAYAKDDYQNLSDKIDFSKHKSIMDVGGGYGAAISQIKEEFPQLECYVFDLPPVIESCDLRVDIFLKAGSFFDEIPKVSDAIILSRILHDWNDDKASEILNNVYDALPEKGHLYVIENCTDKINIDLTLLSLNMLALCESFERSSYEYIALANKAGFIFQEAKSLNELQTILTFTK